MGATPPRPSAPTKRTDCLRHGQTEQLGRATGWTLGGTGPRARRDGAGTWATTSWCQLARARRTDASCCRPTTRAREAGLRLLEDADADATKAHGRVMRGARRRDARLLEGGGREGRGGGRRRTEGRQVTPPRRGAASRGGAPPRAPPRRRAPSPRVRGSRARAGGGRQSRAAASASQQSQPE